MKKFSMIDAAALVVWVVPIIYLFVIYPALPAIVATHYGIDGKANGFGTKDKFLVLQLVISAITIGLYFLLKYLPLIDPKRQGKLNEATSQKLGLGLVIFMSAINLAITFGAINKSFKIDKIVFPLIGLLFAFMGNIMYSFKPNRFFGVRTPWTLGSEENWRVTHRLAGKVWFAGGILITILVLWVPTKMALLVFSPVLFVMCMIPILYSYIYFKKHQH